MTFYNTELSETSVGTLLPEFGLFELRLRKGFHENTITRKTANLLDMLAELGGFLSIVQLVCAYLVGSYVEKQYFNSILKKLFKHQKDLIPHNKKVKTQMAA
mmetsp:Transcript_20124/g.19095  ORF Transcript_20124/g.19095 Transcript_20124/m.19095 type:complete len:102 (-) Transcript_20124:248-553(-)